jgi:hypothetical protein
MSGRITIEKDGLESILTKFEMLERGGVDKLLKASARLCAVQLAHWTQPFSVGQTGKGKAYEKGTTRVSHDVYKVIRSNEKLLAISEHIKNPSIYARMIALINAGDYDAVAKILKATHISIGFGSDVEVLKNEGSIRQAHKKHRNKKSGRTFGKTDKMYIARDGLVKKYIRMVDDRVGKSKAGWADAARRMGAVKGDGSRGIPAWAKKKSHGNNGQAIDSTTGTITGAMTMVNTIPWIDNVCPKTSQEKALDFARQNFIKSVQKAFDYVIKKKEMQIKEFIEQEVNSTNTGE